jgi:4-diphosphocytidyl-2-C-methyl-D-erythritol kinase
VRLYDGFNISIMIIETQDFASLRKRPLLQQKYATNKAWFLGEGSVYFKRKVWVMEKIDIKAPAKINLFLKVLGKRNDGYHDIFSWFQAVSLFDNLSFEKKSQPGFELDIEGSDQLSCADDNLIIKTSLILFEKFKLPGGLKIKLKKNIPIAAGLAGGSSDAAATIYGINTLFGLNLDSDRMKEIGLLLGSDIPFFFSSGQAEVTGRGEVIEDISLPVDYHIVLVTPSFPISTADSYRRLKMGLTIRMEDIKLFHCPSLMDLVGGICDIGNDFEKLHLESCPELGEIKDALNKAGAILSRMSGSGPTVFGIFDKMPEREDLLQITRGDWRIYTARPISLPAWDWH